MSTPKTIDFTWELREAIKESEMAARHALEIDLSERLIGRTVSISCYERSGMKVEKQITEVVCVVAFVEVADEGQQVTISSAEGIKYLPHPPLGIVILEDDS